MITDRVRKVPGTLIRIDKRRVCTSPVRSCGKLVAAPWIRWRPHWIAPVTSPSAIRRKSYANETKFPTRSLRFMFGHMWGTPPPNGMACAAAVKSTLVQSTLEDYDKQEPDIFQGRCRRPRTGHGFCPVCGHRGRHAENTVNQLRTALLVITRLRRIDVTVDGTRMAIRDRKLTTHRSLCAGRPHVTWRNPRPKRSVIQRSKSVRGIV